MTKTGSIYLIAIICLLTEIGHARIDTLYSCRPGDPVNLQVDTSFAAYSWQPTTRLDNPTIPGPIASPLATTLYMAESISASGENLIVNGDFSDGNTGFTSQYVYSPGANPTQGVYGVFFSGRDLSPQFFANCRDHTDGMGRLMAVDGSPQSNQEVWCQTVAVQPNTNYAFSTWVTTILPSNPAQLQFSINGQALGTPFSPTNTTCTWLQFYETWFSATSEVAEICVINQNTNPNGNDFALDDFTFFELGETVRDSFLVIVDNNTPAVIDTALCAGSTLAYAGESVLAGTSRTFEFTSLHGCDSTVILNLGILDTLFEYFRVDTLCPGEQFDFYGNTVFQDTVLCERTSQGGTCDTIVCLTAVFLTEAAIVIDDSPPTCFGDANGSIAVAVEAGLPPYTYRWADGAAEAFRTDLPSGSYTLEVEDAKACRAAVSVFLSEPEVLSLTANGSSQFCDGRVVGQIEVIASGGTPPFQYAIEGENFQANATLNDLMPGPYNALVKDANNCIATTAVEIPAPFTPTLLIVGDQLTQLGELVIAEGLTDALGPLSYQWSPTTGVACPTCATTEILPLETTNYTFTATDPLGCTLRANWLLQVDRNATIYIPNAFSPNGDGVNDTFGVYVGKGAEMIQDFGIYDRWGNQLFYQTACLPNDPSCFWDGSIVKGLLPVGIYVYTLEVLLINGILERRSGTVLLTR